MLKHLVAIRMKSILSGFAGRGKGKVSAGKKILLGILAVYILIVFGSMFFGLFNSTYTAFSGVGMEWLYFGFMGVLVFTLCFVGSVFVTQQQLFEAKDNDLLLSMPVPVRNILTSRLLSILLLNYIYEFLVMGPGLITYLRKGQVQIEGLCYFLLSFLLLPLLVLTVSVLFGWIIAAVDARLGRKNLVMTGLTAGLLLVYLYFCFQIQDYMTRLIENGAAVGEAIKKALPPFYYMGRAIAEGNSLFFLFFLLCCLVPFAAVYLVLSRSFIRIATAERGRKKVVYKEKAIGMRSVRQALFLKDLGHFLGSPMYVFNSSIGLVFMVVCAGYLFIKAGELQELEYALYMLTGSREVIGPALCAAMGLMASMVNISSPMISIEAKTLWICQSLPVRPQDVIFAKANVHILVSLPFVLIGAILMELSFPMGIVSRILLVAFPIAVTVFNAYLGIMLNLLYPKFDWINEIDAVKQGLAPMLAVFIPMATIVLPVLLYTAIFNRILNPPVYVMIVLFLFVVACFVLRRYLCQRGTKRFLQL